jgi:hypothetical protein
MSSLKGAFSKVYTGGPAVEEMLDLRLVADTVLSSCFLISPFFDFGSLSSISMAALVFAPLTIFV